MPGVVLIVEDEAVLARNIKMFLERKGFEAITAGNVSEGLARYSDCQPDAVLIDYNLPDGNGVDFIRRIRAADRLTKLIMTTAYGSVEIAVEAMKAGADDYLTKPVSLDEMIILLERLLAQARNERDLSYFRDREKQKSGIDLILGSSPPLLELKKRIALVIEADEQAAKEGMPGPPVLILGETGTGKELVARALHYDGPRRARPFVEINCAALPEQLVESELFGHEKGAFTGARERSRGLFQAADGGTLFLDEIGEMPLPLQAKLLKAIEDRSVRPVGSVRDHKIDARIVAASNAALDERSLTGEFRKDLYYRLNTVTIATPELRTRGADIMALADVFRLEFERRYGRQALQFSADAKEAMSRYYWPGNIRELRNIVEQAVLLGAGNVITRRDLNLREIQPLSELQAQDARGKPDTLASAELQMIRDALRQHQGNVSMAARTLGISRDTLRYRMERLSLSRDEFL